MAKLVLQRTCIGCQTKKNKKDLLRLIIKKNSLVLGKGKKGLGRGAYLCKESNNKFKKDCLAAALERKSFNYAFRKKINTKEFEKTSRHSLSGPR